MSINYQDQNNYADLAESITTAGRPASCIKEKKKKGKKKINPQNPQTPPPTHTEEQSKEEGVYGT